MIAASADTFFGYFLDVWAGEPRAIPADVRTAYRDACRAAVPSIVADGRAGSVSYDDIVTRQPDGWKISYRKVTARRAALGEKEAGPREVLERLRQAAISQSADEMSRVYAVDAVHEFPFTPPGVPSRLEGRDEIVSWIAAGWKAYPLKYERYRTLAIHDTSDPGTIIVEQLTEIGLTRPATRIVGIHTPPRGCAVRGGTDAHDNPAA
jgi:hypothetical protein